MTKLVIFGRGGQLTWECVQTFCRQSTRTVLMTTLKLKPLISHQNYPLFQKVSRNQRLWVRVNTGSWNLPSSHHICSSHHAALETRKNHPSFYQSMYLSVFPCWIVFSPEPGVLESVKSLFRRRIHTSSWYLFTLRRMFWNKFTIFHELPPNRNLN